MRVPIGVVGAISPFNFPLNLVAHKVAPAIAAGCPVVLKPAGQTPFSAIALAWLLIEECGLPASYLSVVTGPGSVVGNALVDHPDVALITFTGSPEVGWGIKARAPRKHVGLELGNNAPVIIAEDGDWQKAADKIQDRRLLARRPVVHLDATHLRPRVGGGRRSPTRLKEGVETLVVGDPLDATTRRVRADLRRASGTASRAGSTRPSRRAARSSTGGRLDDNGVLVPTVIANAKPEMQVCIKEVFGPVVAIQSIDSVDEGL